MVKVCFQGISYDPAAYWLSLQPAVFLEARTVVHGVTLPELLDGILNAESVDGF